MIRIAFASAIASVTRSKNSWSRGDATADRVGLVVDVSRWIVWMEDHVIDLGRVEIEDLCFSVINPDNRVIMAGHGVCPRSHLEATAGRLRSSCFCFVSRNRLLIYGP